jgi:hypothetical protein
VHRLTCPLNCQRVSAQDGLSPKLSEGGCTGWPAKLSEGECTGWPVLNWLQFYCKQLKRCTASFTICSTLCDLPLARMRCIRLLVNGWTASRANRKGIRHKYPSKLPSLLLPPAQPSTCDPCCRCIPASSQQTLHMSCI